MRDRVAHHYWATDREVVWATATVAVPESVQFSRQRWPVSDSRTASTAVAILPQPSTRLNPPPEQFTFFSRYSRHVAERHRLLSDHSLGDA